MLGIWNAYFPAFGALPPAPGTRVAPNPNCLSVEKIERISKIERDRSQRCSRRDCDSWHMLRGRSWFEGSKSKPFLLMYAVLAICPSETSGFQIERNTGHSVTKTSTGLGARRALQASCPAGRYGDANQCIDCQAGSVTNTGASPGATTCTACPPGSYSLQ